MNLELSGLCKSYGKKSVLENISLSFEEGKIHALLGENGAGKSTLAKIISGRETPDSGSVILDGKKIAVASPTIALQNGIAEVQQRPLLSPSLSGKENLFLSGFNFSKDTKKSGLKKIFSFVPAKIPGEILSLQKKWAPDLNLNAQVKNMGGNGRFYLSLIASLLKSPRFLILDEPSAFLDPDERKSLYEKLREFVGEKKSILVITHNRAEALHYADTITLLDDGKVYARLNSPDEFKDFSFGGFKSTSNKNSSTSEKKESAISVGTSDTLCLSFTHASFKPHDSAALFDASFEVHYGKISAVTGIKEAAMDTLENLVTGMAGSGAKGSAVFRTKNSDRFEMDLKKGRYGISFLRKHNAAIIPSDKTFRASNPNLSVEQMLSVNETSRMKKEERQTALKKIINDAGINAELSDPCSSLSGGMLQRLVLSRELSRNPDLIIFCNPMQALDLESQGRLASKIRSLSEEGKAVLIIGAEDFPLSFCHKVYSLEGGIISLSYSREDGN